MVPVSVQRISRSEADVHLDSLGVLHVTVGLGEESVIPILGSASKNQYSIHSYTYYLIRVLEPEIWKGCQVIVV